MPWAKRWPGRKRRNECRSAERRAARSAETYPARLQFRRRYSRAQSRRRPRRQARLYRSARRAGPMAISPTASSASATCCARSASRREERILICLLDGIDWPTAFLGAIKAGIVPVPVNTLLTDGRLSLHARGQPGAAFGRVGRAVSEIRRPRSARAADLAHVIVSGANGHGHPRFEDLLAGRRRPSRRPRRPCATTSASGSTRRARPASPRPRCTPTPL